MSAFVLTGGRCLFELNQEGRILSLWEPEKPPLGFQNCQLYLFKYIYFAAERY